MSWNSDPPRGGPMVKVKGFPRELHVGESADGPDVVAYKRTAARCGAWPWDPAGWDDTYSGRFAHGDHDSPDTHAGIEGLQEWAGSIPAADYAIVTEQTFNFLRSVRVPQGRTHAGEPAMDSLAAHLIDQAYDATRPPPPKITVREAALELARTQLGVKENPAGSNVVEYSDWYGMVGPWCAMFATWCYDGPDGLGSASFAKSEGRYAYVPYIVADARGGRYGLSPTSSPLPGDLVCYDWDGAGEYDHVGLFEAWQDGNVVFTAIEGNTSTSNNSNGGEVMRRSRNVNAQATVFVRVAE